MGTISWTQGESPLALFAEGFRQELAHRGHPPSTVKDQMTLVGQLSCWLGAQGLSPGELTKARAEEFLAARRALGQRRVPTLASFKVLFEHLEALQVLAPEQPSAPTPSDDLLGRYRRHLVQDRGLMPTTIVRYERFARRFLAQRATRTGLETGAEGLTGPEVNDYLLEAGSRLVVESAKREAADLRSLLRFLYSSGLLANDHGSAMPPVAAWRGTRLPPTMNQADVGALLDSCDLSTVRGRRDRAVLALLARLGLRSAEVAGLQLDDIDWRRGELVVRGKARRRDRLPLPVEAGEAVVGYLRDGRPRSEHREVFLTLYAPHPPIKPSSIANIVYDACERAGVTRVGGHRLRHALATEMLRQGGDLVEIAQILRQSDLGTTSGYAKVDRAALRAVAQPWPGAQL